MDYVKYSAKAVWALVVPILITFIQANSEVVADWVAGLVGAALTAAVVWLQRNGPQPTS
jgi:hypothetical protein